MSKPLVIVESPAKARTLARLLGDEYRVEASVGHIRDLPENASEVPAAIKDKPWGRMGVDVDNAFQPYYVVPRDKAGRIRDLRAAAKDVPEILLATDPDREGESISWHLREVLKPTVPVRRIQFHEITEEAVRHALADARDIDLQLVDAQESRRIVDRLYGYMVSPVLWKKVQTGLSAGRVQSVAVRLVVEREEARRAFRRSVYWGLEAQLGATGHRSTRHWRARHAGVWRAARTLIRPPASCKDPEMQTMDEAAAGALRDALRGRLPWTVTTVDERPGRQAPAASVHDIDTPAGGESQAELLGRSHDERGAAPVPGRDDLVPPHGLDLAQRTRAAGVGGRHPIAVRRRLLRRAARVQDQGEERPGGPRGDPPDRLRQDAAATRARRSDATRSPCTT